MTRAGNFYSQVFVWTVEDGMIQTSPKNDESGNPTTPDTINGLLSQRSPIASEPKIVIRVADINNTLQKIRESSGEVLQGKTPIEGMSMAFAVFKDPEGNRVNLASEWQ